MRNMIRLSARSRSVLKHAGDVFSLKVALGAYHLADTLGTTIPNIPPAFVHTMGEQN